MSEEERKNKKSDKIVKTLKRFLSLINKTKKDKD